MQLKLLLVLTLAAMATGAFNGLRGGGSTFLYDAPEFAIRACPKQVSSCVFDGVPTVGATNCGRCVSRCLGDDFDTFDLFGCHRDVERSQVASCRTAGQCYMKCRRRFQAVRSGPNGDRDFEKCLQGACCAAVGSCTASTCQRQKQCYKVDAPAQGALKRCVAQCRCR